MVTHRTVIAAALTAAAIAGRAAPGVAAITPAAGWTAYAIATPATVQGGIVRAGNAILVGQGAFGAGLQSVVRIDGSGVTTIATGFNSLGGFALDASGTLYVVDNGGELPGAATGDTVFAIPNALTRITAVPALGAEVAPAGSIPSAQDVALDGSDLIVSDAAGPGAGRVVRVSGGIVTDLITGLDYTAGVSVAGSELLVGNVDGSFVGSLAEYTTAGSFVAMRATGLSGNYAHAVDNDGNVLITGGFTDDFSSSTLLALAPGGGIAERARGFVFSTELFHDLVRDETLVLDVGGSAITALCRDSDADGICNADEACVGGVTLVKPRLQLRKLDTPVGDDGLAFRGELTIPTMPPLDPVAHGVRVVVEDSTGPVVDAAIPGGLVDPLTKIGWKPNQTATAWTYTNKTGYQGITRVAVKLSSKVPGLVTFRVVGKKGAFATTAADLPLTATFALRPAGQCGTADFSGPAPVCAFNAKNSTLTCK